MPLLNDIHRTILCDTLKVFAVTMVAALLLMVLGGGAKEGLSRGLPPHLVLRILPYLLPEMLRFVVPGCLLFALCSVFGQMAAANEIVALKSLGINPLRVVWPALALAYALSLCTYGLYEICAVWARPNLQQQVAQSLHEIAYSYLRANRVFSSQGVSIVVRDVAVDQLIRPVVSIDAGKNQGPVVLTAERARLRSDSKRGVLHIECEHGQLSVAGKASLSFPDRLVHDVVLRDFRSLEEDHLSPAALGMVGISRQLLKEREQIVLLEQQRRPDIDPLSPGVNPEDEFLAWRRERFHRLLAEPSRRLSNGLGCLCFALVGIPVALLRRSGDVMSVFFLCFLPILLLYYPLLVLGESLARQGHFPQYSVWLADAVLCVIGLGLLHRSMRH